MLKRNLGLISSILFLLSSSIVSTPTQPFIADRIIESDSVEINNLRNEIVDKVHEVNVVEKQRNITEDVIEEEIVEINIESDMFVEEVEIVYNPYNLLERSNITREQAYEILEGSALQSLHRGYVYMEEVYGINALFLMALSSEESAHGTSSLAMYNNNIGGIKARDGSWAVFSDWMDCLSYKADLLYNQYLSENGSYFNGYSIWNVNEFYCEGTQWAENLNVIAYELLNKLN